MGHATDVTSATLIFTKIACSQPPSLTTTSSKTPPSKSSINLLKNLLIIVKTAKDTATLVQDLFEVFPTIAKKKGGIFTPVAEIFRIIRLLQILSLSFAIRCHQSAYGATRRILKALCPASGAGPMYPNVKSIIFMSIARRI